MSKIAENALDCAVDVVERFSGMTFGETHDAHDWLVRQIQLAAMTVAEEVENNQIKSIYHDVIPKGTKFVAMYLDGSGAQVFLKDDNGDLYDAGGDPASKEALSDNFAIWLDLGDFKLWMEYPNND